MGAASSQPAPKLDLSNATLTVADAQAQASYIASQAAATASSGAWGTAKVIIGILVFLLVLGGIATGIYYIFFNKQAITLKILAATFGSTDITSALQSQVKTDSILLPKGASDIPGLTGLTGSGSMTYQFSDETNPTTATISSPTETIEVSLANRNGTEHYTNKRQTNAPTGPTVWSRLRSLFVAGSGDQLPYSKDASTEAIIPAAAAPSSAGKDGAYGIQFWMYVKDWNYNFGKEKHVLSRSDSTNPGIMSPSITLHPTDNSLKVSISVFPDDPSSSSKLEPAPAGHSGSTDDVFVCEVPNLPLQSWVAVSLTVFQRNLDIYLDGKLVKSCVLSGVPKPAVGDIHVNKDGGFSGYVCNLYHYPRMLTPTDASSFYGAGTSCTTSTDKGPVSTATGYTVNFGIYDAAGKKVSDYVF